MNFSSNLYGMLGVTPVGNGFGVSTGMSGALSGEADVMMISGVGATESTGTPPSIPSPTLSGQLSVPVTIGTMTYPLYVWLILAALLGGAGGYYLGRR